jgi:hypothetical protein
VTGSRRDEPSPGVPATHRDLLTAAYAAFNARDIDGALATMHPDVEWPNGMEGGWHWTRQWRTIDPRVEPRRFVRDEAGQIVIDVHQVVRDQSGRIVADQMVQHVYVIEHDLVRRMEIRVADRVVEPAAAPEPPGDRGGDAGGLRMDEHEHAKLLGLGPEGMELRVGQLLAVDAAADGGAAQAVLPDALLELLGGEVGMLQGDRVRGAGLGELLVLQRDELRGPPRTSRR